MCSFQQTTIKLGESEIYCRENHKKISQYLRININHVLLQCQVCHIYCDILIRKWSEINTSALPILVWKWMKYFWKGWNISDQWASVCTSHQSWYLWFCGGGRRKDNLHQWRHLLSCTKYYILALVFTFTWRQGYTAANGGWKHFEISKNCLFLYYQKHLQPAVADNLLLDNQNSLVALLLHFSSEHLSFNFSTNILLSHLKGLQLNQ